MSRFKIGPPVRQLGCHMAGRWWLCWLNPKSRNMSTRRNLAHVPRNWIWSTNVVHVRMMMQMHTRILDAVKQNGQIVKDFQYIFLLSLWIVRRYACSRICNDQLGQIIKIIIGDRPVFTKLTILPVDISKLLLIRTLQPIHIGFKNFESDPRWRAAKQVYRIFGESGWTIPELCTFRLRAFLVMCLNQLYLP